MTNPTTPQPVQEPAGAVAALKLAERLKAICDSHIDSASAHEAAYRLIESLASLQPVTQAKSEVVAWQFRDRTSSPWCWISCNNETFAQCSEKPSLYEVRPLYAAPQEAVERQPLTADEVNVERSRPCYLGDAFEAGVRYAERMHGIGPATQEKQHG